MSDFEPYSGTHNVIKAESDYNNILDHAFEKPFKFLVRKNGSNYEVLHGMGSDQAGKILGTPSTSAEEQIEAAVNNLTVGRAYREKIALLGDFTTDDEISLDSNLELEILGRVKLGDSVNKRIFSATNKTNIFIHNGEVDGNKTNNSYLVGTENVKEPFRFVNCSQVRIQNVWLHDAVDQGIYFSTPTDCQILDCRIDDGVFALIHMRDAVASIIRGNYFSGTSERGEGIALTESGSGLSNGCEISGNRMKMTYLFNTGIAFNGIEHRIINNLVDGAAHGITGTGCFYIYGKRHILQGNIAKNAQTGNHGFIFGAASNNHTLKNNYAILNARHGFYLGSSVLCSLKGNYAISNSQELTATYAGFQLAGTTYSTFEGNHSVSDAALSALIQSRGFNETSITTDYNQYLNNRIYGNTSNIIYAWGQNNIVRGNIGYNPVGLDATPFYDTSPYGINHLLGTAAAPTSARAYPVRNHDVLVTSVNTGAGTTDITIKSPGASTILSGVTTLNCQFVPIGYTITWTWAATAPTVTVHFL